MARGNQTIFYDVVNRGNQGCASTIGAERSNDPTTLAHAGDGFMMRQGYSWFGAAGRATFSQRRPIDGELSRGEKSRRQSDQALDFHRVCFSKTELFSAAELRPWIGRHQTLSGGGREHGQSAADGARRSHALAKLIPNDQWSFARCPDGKGRRRAHADICYAAGFSPNFIYELTYEARDPMVMGLGFAATRDLISFLRYDISREQSTVQRQRQKSPRWAIGFGSSQSGRFLKDMLYQGFNQTSRARSYSTVSSRISRLRGGPSRILNLPCPGVFQRRWKATTRPATSFPLPTKR